MAQIKVAKYGGNEELFSFYKENPYYNVGDFLMGSSKVEDGWENNMYIIRAVTHFLPNDNGDFLMYLHVEEYNPSKVAGEFEKLAEKIKGMARRNAEKK